jgi:hypothetical protein
MQLVGVLIILIGMYLADSAVRNRPPVAFIKALIADPSNLTGTLSSMNGTWQVRDTGTPVVGGVGERETPGQAGSSAGLSGRPSGVTGSNGQLPDSELKKLSWTGAKLHRQAAPSFESLNAAFKARFGRNISVTDGYRTLATQRALKATKGRMAATPGTSNHGWGFAADLGGGINRFGTDEYEWMLANAPTFGWVNPDWARKGKGKEEPWHWEFVGSRNSTGGRF